MYVSLFFLDAAPELVITRTSVPNNAWALSVQLINQLYIITRYKISVQANRSIKPAKIGHRQLFNKGLYQILLAPKSLSYRNSATAAYEDNRVINSLNKGGRAVGHELELEYGNRIIQVIAVTVNGAA